VASIAGTAGSLFAMSYQYDQLLSQCPGTPNCVSSLSSDQKYLVAPYITVDPVWQVWPTMKAIIIKLPRSKLVEEKPGYLHVEVRSRIFGFLDHLELAADPEEHLVNVRSASVLGYSDLGVNRRRVEFLRTQFAEAGLLQHSTL
jgi:uncharacterized protein (DUF1499 family)